jgi:hypothetical protein
MQFLRVENHGVLIYVNRHGRERCFNIFITDHVLNIAPPVQDILPDPVRPRHLKKRSGFVGWRGVGFSIAPLNNTSALKENWNRCATIRGPGCGAHDMRAAGADLQCDRFLGKNPDQPASFGGHSCMRRKFSGAGSGKIDKIPRTRAHGLSGRWVPRGPRVVVSR